MLDLLFFVLCAYGMTFIIVYGSIFNKIRPNKESGFFGKLLNCPLCTGFWSGVFLAIISPYTSLFTFGNSPVDYFLLGCLSSGVSYLLSSVVKDDGIQIKRR